jgi:hypothetical protein
MAEYNFPDISGFSEQEQAALNYHRNNLRANTALKNKDNSLTTFYGTVVETPEGAMVLPTYWHGQVRDVPQSLRFAVKSGINFPKYKSVDEALSAEKRMHDIMEQDINVFTSPRK